MSALRAAVAALVGTAWEAARAAAVDVQLLQWNLHGECFQRCEGHNYAHCDRNFPACRTHSTAFLTDLMDGKHAPGGMPDFAGVEQLGDHGFLSKGLEHHGQAEHICGGKHGFGQYPFDVAVLYYKKERWHPISRPVGGCMEHVWGAPVNNYRAYVMQAFSLKEDSRTKVIVVVAHYSHAVWGLPAMRQDLQSMQLRTGVAQTILLADTNRECGTSSWHIMKALYPAAKQVTSASLHRTCCVPHFQHCYDRIIAAQFPGATGLMPTSLPLPEFVVQEWSAPNQHHPIKAKLSFHSEPPETTARLI